MSNAFELEPGSTIGHFRIDKKLGEGGMGAVFLAKDLTLSRHVAIKFMSRAQVAQNTKASVRQSMEKRFIREAKSAAAINHPNIAQIYEANFETDIWYIAMEYIEGQSLFDQMAEGKRYSIEEVVSICKQTIYGLDHAWSKYKIIHRDIKPHNLMLSGDGLVKIVDLGLAKPLEQQNDDTQGIELTGAGTPLGTPPYMAPEQAAGNKDINFSADIFSLGATIYELLAGQKAFNEKSAPMVYMSQVQKKYPPIKDLNPDTPDSMVSLIDAMLEPKVEDRISSYGEIQIKLDRVTHGNIDRSPDNQVQGTLVHCPNCEHKMSFDQPMDKDEVQCPKCKAAIQVSNNQSKKEKKGLAKQNPQVFSPSKASSKNRKGLILESFTSDECLILEQEYGIQSQDLHALQFELSWESGILALILGSQISSIDESVSGLNDPIQIQSEFKQKRSDYHEFICDQFKIFTDIHKSLHSVMTKDLEIVLNSNELNALFGFANKTEILFAGLREFHHSVAGQPFPKDKLTIDLKRFVFDWMPAKMSKSILKEPAYMSDLYSQLHQILLSWCPFYFGILNQLIDRLKDQESKSRDSIIANFQYSFLPPNFYQFYCLSRELNIGFHKAKSVASNLVVE